MVLISRLIKNKVPCGALNESSSYPTLAPIFECLLPSLWNCLEKIRKNGLVGGGMSLGASFKVLKDQAVTSVFSVFCLLSRGELSAAAPDATTYPAVFHYGLLSLRNSQPLCIQINTSSISCLGREKQYIPTIRNKNERYQYFILL